MGGGISFPSNYGVWERRKLSRQGPGRSPSQNDFSAFIASQNASSCTA